MRRSARPSARGEILTSNKWRQRVGRMTYGGKSLDWSQMAIDSSCQQLGAPSKQITLRKTMAVRCIGNDTRAAQRSMRAVATTATFAVTSTVSLSTRLHECVFTQHALHLRCKENIDAIWCMYSWACIWRGDYLPSRPVGRRQCET